MLLFLFITILRTDKRLLGFFVLFFFLPVLGVSRDPGAGAPSWEVRTFVKDQGLEESMGHFPFPGKEPGIVLRTTNKSISVS